MNKYVWISLAFAGVGICSFIYFKWKKKSNPKHKQIKDSSQENADKYHELENIYIQRKSFKKSGIPNYGNTCYLNSTLQILASTPNFVDSTSKLQAILFRNLSSIFSLMLSPHSSSSFKRAILQLLNTLKENYSMFEINAQNDCKELYNIIIDQYLEELSFEKNRFQIKKNQVVICEKGHKDIISDESLFLAIPTKDKLNVIACLENIEKEENKLSLRCQSCQEVNDSIVKVNFLELPEILVFYVADRSNKDRNHQPYIKYKKSEYKIYAVICYYEAGPNGHYIAYTLDDGKWCKYNDAFVEEDQPDYDHAYMLFYSKLNKII